MRIQDRPWDSFFRKITLLFLGRAKRWFAFLYPPIPIQMEDTLPHLEMDEESNAKLPGPGVSLKIYRNRIINAGMTATFGALVFTLVISWIWPFLIGSGINFVFIGILLRYRSCFQSQYPIIARQCTKNVIWLVLLEVVTIGILAVLIFAEHQVVRWYL